MAERHLIRITDEDIADANRLSLSCPICASAVEKNPELRAMSPVVCAKCKTLYHRLCWEQNDNSCATLGCAHDRCYEYGAVVGPLLKVDYSDIPKTVPSQGFSPNGRFKKLKDQELQQKESGSRGFWDRFLVRLFRAVGWR
jgi:hypothetical protein